VSAADVYSKEVHSQLKRYATWLPTEEVKVGTVGQLQGKIFVPLSDLKTFGISANVVKDPSTQAAYKFMSSGTKEVALDASAGGVATSAGIGAAKLNISFSREHSVYFSLAGCAGYAIDDLVNLGHSVLEQLNKQKWQLDYVVVTRVVTAESATILQAESKGAAIELEGDTSGTSVADLLKAGASVKVKSQSSVGLSIVAKRNLTPLLRLAGVKYTFFDQLRRSKPKFSYTLAHDSIGLTPFRSHVDASPSVNFATKALAKDALLLNVDLPQFDNYVDIAGLLDLTARTATVRSTSSPNLRINRLEGFDLCTRIHRKRLLDVVDKLPYVDFDKKAATGDFIKLKLRLPKSGSAVSMAPLFNLCMKAAEPLPQAKISAELYFAEIP